MAKGVMKLTRTERANLALDKAGRAYLAAQKPRAILANLDALLTALDAWLAAREADMPRAKPGPKPAKPSKASKPGKPSKARKARKARKASKASNLPTEG